MVYESIVYLLPITILLLVIINSIVVLWVFIDSKKNNYDNGLYYALLEILLPLVGLVLYLINKKKYI